MAKRIGATNKFAPVKGLITEANPLAFPQDAAVDLDNVIIDNQGKVSRRLGIDLEEDGSVITSGALNISADIATSTYLWERAGGQVGRNYHITQWGSLIRISEDTNVISQGANVYNLSAVGAGAPYHRVQYVEAGEGLILIWRDEFPIYLYIDRSGMLTSRRVLPKIRALSILEPNAVDSSPNNNSKVYPNPMAHEEEFNLRNTGWPWLASIAPNAKGDGSPGAGDPLRNVLGVTGNYPSHLVNYHTLKLSSAEEVPSIGTFSAYEIGKVNFGNTVPAVGHYIHDAYSFDPKALLEAEAAQEELDVLSSGSGKILGALLLAAIGAPDSGSDDKVLSTYYKDASANVWFNNNRPLTAAFLNGHALFADIDENNSTRILISQLVRRSEDLSKCYQEADPTAEEINDLVATDGWVMHPKGMGTPVRMVQNNNGVVLLCANGAWLIGGDASFSATDYSAKKVAEFDFSSPDSVVVVENTIILFSAEGILALSPNEFGELTVKNLSRDTIDSLYRSYTKDQLSKAVGAITESDTAVTWVIPNNGYYGEAVLRFDVRLGAFYKFSIDTGEVGPKLLAPMERSIAYYTTELNPLTTVDGEQITTVAGEPIGDEITNTRRSLGELGFLAASPTSVFYAAMSDASFHDFAYTNTPYNYTSFVEFGYVYPETMIGGIQAPYIHSYFGTKREGVTSVPVPFPTPPLPEVGELTIALDAPIVRQIVEENRDGRDYPPSAFGFSGKRTAYCAHNTVLLSGAGDINYTSWVAAGLVSVPDPSLEEATVFCGFAGGCSAIGARLENIDTDALLNRMASGPAMGTAIQNVSSSSIQYNPGEGDSSLYDNYFTIEGMEIIGVLIAFPGDRASKADGVTPLTPNREVLDTVNQVGKTDTQPYDGYYDSIDGGYITPPSFTAPVLEVDRDCIDSGYRYSTVGGYSHFDGYTGTDALADGNLRLLVSVPNGVVPADAINTTFGDSTVTITTPSGGTWSGSVGVASPAANMRTISRSQRGDDVISYDRNDGEGVQYLNIQLVRALGGQLSQDAIRDILLNGDRITIKWERTL